MAVAEAPGKSEMRQKHGLCSDYCKGCGHLTRGSGFGPICNYILDTGHMRPCPGGDGCTAHTRKTQERVRSRIEGVAIVKDPPPKTHSPLPIISDAAMLEEFRRGASDKEMMETFGVSLHTVKRKRQKMGLFRAPRKKEGEPYEGNEG